MLEKLLRSMLMIALLSGASAMAADTVAPKNNALQVAEAEADEDVDDDEDEEELELEKELPESPLELVDGEEKSLGELTEASEVEFTVEAENKGKEEVFFKRAMSTCACLKILESPEAGKIAPGARITIRAKLTGSRLGHQAGKWKRWIYLETKGYSQAALEISGTFSPLIAISPDATMYLGEFEGADVQWVRTYTISATNPEKSPDLIILPPKESKRFELKLTLKDEKARKFELEIRPRLPMVPGRFGELVFLPVPMLGKDIGIRLRIFGKVLGRKFVLSNRAFRIKEADFANGASQTRKLTVTLKDRDFWQLRNAGPTELVRLKNERGKLNHHDLKDKAKGQFYVNREEKAAREERAADYMDKVLSGVELTGGKEVTVTRETKGDTITFTLTVSPQILQAPEKKVALKLKMNGVTQREIEVYVSDKARVEKRRGIRRNDGE